MSEPLKLTPIDQIEDMADGVPVLAVEGTVKYAQEIKHGTSTKGVAWNKQFFVLGSETAEIACSMWDAEGSEVSKGETLRIENTQNKKGIWSGMVKGSYQKNGERKHTLEIRANQVKITAPDGGENAKTANIPKAEQEADAERMFPDPDWPDASCETSVKQEARATAPSHGEQAASSRPQNGNGKLKDYAKHAGHVFALAWEESKNTMALIPTKDAEELTTAQWLDLRLRIAQNFAIEINKIIRKEKF